MNTRPPTRAAAFTLAEVMVAMGISVVVLLGIVVSFVSQLGEYRRHRDAVEMSQNAAAAMARVTRDIRLAGYGLPAPAVQIPQWVTWVSGTTNVLRVLPGTGTAPDRLRVVGAFDGACAALATAAIRGQTTLTLQSGQGALFNTANRKLIFLDRQELARITAIAGDVVTISTHPTISGRGLRYPHAIGATIELVQVAEYACNNVFTNTLRRPFLFRNDYRGILTNQLQQLTTLGIQDFQLTSSTSGVAVTITAVAQRTDPKYTDPTYGDRYRRIAITATSTPRNPPP